MARFFRAVGCQTPAAVARPAELKGQQAMLVTEAGMITGAFILETSSVGVTAIYVIRNPDKLQRLVAAATP